MNKRSTIGLAAATAVLGGLGTYGATAAFAAPPDDPRPSTTQSSTIRVTGAGERTGSEGGAKEMIRHCTEQLPSGDRAEARQQMEEMMSGGMMRDMSMHGDDGASGAKSHEG